MGGYIFVSVLVVTIPFASFSPTPLDQLTMNLNLNESPKGEFIGQPYDGGYSDYEGDGADIPDPQFDVKCGQSSAKERIIDGNRVQTNEYPWMTSITFHRPSDPSYALREKHCGGALISKNWVLTAAHCLVDEKVSDPKQIFITLGEHDRTKDTTNIFKTTASHFFINPYYRIFATNYIDDSGNWDITLLRLKEPLDFKSFPNIRPICLPEKDLKHSDDKKYWDEPVRIMGWGLTEKSSYITSAVLRDAKLKVYNNTYCERLFTEYTRPKTPFLICAGAEAHDDESGSKDSCSNDSGGPLVHLHVPEDPFGRMSWEVIGVTSYGEGPLHGGGCGRVGAYTRVSMHLGWIYGVINDYKRSN